MQGRSDFQAWLTAMRARRRRAARWVAAPIAVGAVAAALTVTATADRLLTPSGWPLLLIAFVPVALALAWGTWALARAGRDDSAARIAAAADAERPDFQDRAKTAADLLARPAPGAFDDLVLAETARQVSITDLPATSGETRASRARRLAAATLAAAAIALGAAWPALRDGGTTARVLLVPGSLALSVEPGDARVPIGRPFTIGARASVMPRTPGRALPVLTITTASGVASGEMLAGDDAFTFVTPPVTESFSYSVALGPAVSRTYRVEALPYPNVEGIDLSYRYPAWSGLAPRDERDAGDVYGPAGTEVRLRVRADKPARDAALVMHDGTRVPLGATGDPLAYETTLAVSADGSYRVELTDTDGLTNSDATEYFIRLMDDAPPEVRIVRPSGDQRVTPLAEVAVEARADDDHGVRSLDLVYAVRGQQERVVPLGGGGRTASGRHLIYLEDLGVAPGDFVSFYARARDIARGKQSTEGRSDIFFLEVKPFEEEFAAAQSMAQAGAGAASRQMQNLAAAQKEIIVATWKLERRSGAGQSAADLRAVAGAQRELRQRAAQAAAQAGAQPPARRGRRGGAPPPPEAAAAAPGDEAPAVLLARAGAAMERAASELDRSRPKTALDHENAALNELLKLEAQVRRTEIAQAQGQGGGGGGGGNQDLSALFDRELQRQQQTNYENRSTAQSGSRQQESESEAVRRVREMAERQEALRREQEALARANVSAEERRRQLERLKREQEQLQRELRQLERSTGSTASTSSSGAEAAAEAMGEAAGSLGREDLNRAGEQSARASERLRDLEREMRERGAGGQAQARNDARLEAQQLAEAQRRLAGDAARAERDGQTSDAARRIAAEKERLAERLDALGRRLTAEREAAATARRLAREQRRGAEEWRGSEGSTGSAGSEASAGAEARMAAELEQLARGLGAVPSAAGEADARRLANELDAARSARERLADLERQIDEMRRRAESGGSGQAEAARALQDLQREYGREAARAQQMARGEGAGRGEGRGDGRGEGRGEGVGRRQGADGEGRNDGRGGTPEAAGWLGRSAPGTEQWKQDFSRWESMRRGVAQALESREAALTARLAEQLAAERVHGGYDARTPEAWRKLVAEYYQSIARRRDR